MYAYVCEGYADRRWQQVRRENFAQMAVVELVHRSHDIGVVGKMKSTMLVTLLELHGRRR